MLCVLQHAEQAEQLATDKRLIACEKVAAEGLGLTLLIGAEPETVDWGGMRLGVADGSQHVFERLGQTSGAIAILVETAAWSEALAGLLAALRDRANRRVVVHMGEARIGGAIDQQLVSLGYKRQAPDEALYLFDIETYKDTPDWLSPRNWANPELWDKFRW